MEARRPAEDSPGQGGVCQASEGVLFVFDAPTPLYVGQQSVDQLATCVCSRGDVVGCDQQGGVAGIGAGEGAQGGPGQVIDVYETAILPVRCPLKFRILEALLPDPLDRFVGPHGCGRMHTVGMPVRRLKARQASSPRYFASP